MSRIQNRSFYPKYKLADRPCNSAPSRYQRYLRRLGHIVYKAEVIGGRAGHYVMNGKTISAGELKLRAKAMAEIRGEWSDGREFARY